MTQKTAEQIARNLFKKERLLNVGAGFWRYTEPVSPDMISRRGLEHQASYAVGVALTLITRNNMENSLKLRVTERISILQRTSDYEKEQEKILERKAHKLQNKYNHHGNN